MFGGLFYSRVFVCSHEFMCILRVSVIPCFSELHAVAARSGVQRLSFVESQRDSFQREGMKPVLLFPSLHIWIDVFFQYLTFACGGVFFWLFGSIIQLLRYREIGGYSRQSSGLGAYLWIDHFVLLMVGILVFAFPSQMLRLVVSHKVSANLFCSNLSCLDQKRESHYRRGARLLLPMHGGIDYWPRFDVLFSSRLLLQRG